MIEIFSILENDQYEVIGDLKATDVITDNNNNPGYVTEAKPILPGILTKAKIAPVEKILILEIGQKYPVFRKAKFE